MKRLPLKNKMLAGIAVLCIVSLITWAYTTFNSAQHEALQSDLAKTLDSEPISYQANQAFDLTGVLNNGTTQEPVYNQMLDFTGTLTLSYGEATVYPSLDDAGFSWDQCTFDSADSLSNFYDDPVFVVVPLHIHNKDAELSEDTIKDLGGEGINVFCRLETDAGYSAELSATKVVKSDVSGKDIDGFDLIWAEPGSDADVYLGFFINRSEAQQTFNLDLTGFSANPSLLVNLGQAKEAVAS